MNKIQFVYLLKLFLILLSSSCIDDKSKGVDVEITYSHEDGCDSFTLNSTKQKKYKGHSEHKTNNKIVHQKTMAYKLTNNPDGSLTLDADVTFKKMGEEIKYWSKKIIIKENGKINLKPFNEVDMIIESSGFLK